MGTNPNKKMAATRTNAGLRPDQSAKVRAKQRWGLADPIYNRPRRASPHGSAPNLVRSGTKQPQALRPVPGVRLVTLLNDTAGAAGPSRRCSRHAPGPGTPGPGARRLQRRDGPAAHAASLRRVTSLTPGTGRN